MKFLIAGLGSIGRRHLRNLLALGEEDIVLYRTGKSTLPDDEMDRFPTENSLEKALAHDPDAVIISNPSALHLDVAIPAARAGCHLLIEKPLSNSMERIEVLRKVVQDGGSRVLMGFQFRFHPGIQATKDAIENEEVGRAIYAHAHWGEYLPDWHPWEDYRNSYAARSELGGGVALTLCHPFDYFRFLFGEATSISGWVDQISDLDLDVDDVAEAEIRYQGGVVASVHLNFFQRPDHHGFDVICTNGILRWDNSSGDLLIYHPEERQRKVFHLNEGFKRNNLFIDEMAHFIDVIADKASPLCNLDDGIEALRVANVIRQTNAR